MHLLKKFENFYRSNYFEKETKYKKLRIYLKNSKISIKIIDLKKEKKYKKSKEKHLPLLITNLLRIYLKNFYFITTLKKERRRGENCKRSGENSAEKRLSHVSRVHRAAEGGCTRATYPGGDRLSLSLLSR